MSVNDSINKIIKNGLQEGEKRLSDDDFIDSGGIRYCRICNSPKQARVEFMNEVIILPVMCKCAEEKFKILEESENKRRHQVKVERMKRNGITDAAYNNCTMENDDGKDKKMSKICKAYIDEFELMYKSNTGLIFHGDFGTGKTFYASAIANGILNTGKSVLVTNIPYILSAIQGFGENEDIIMGYMRNCSLVVIDDLGSERSTEYTMEKIYSLIDTRYRSGKPIIITTNLTPCEIKNEQDIRRKRIYSKITEMCIPVIVEGECRRTKKGIDKSIEARRILFNN